MERRAFIAGTAGTLAAGALGRPASAQAAPILVGYWPISAALPFFVADKNGYWKDAGVNVQLVKFADQVKVTEALLAGRIQATATGTGSTQLATAEIASPNFFKILGANLSSDKSILDSFIVAKGAPYKHISDLKGKKVACGVGPQAVVEATIILQKAGVPATSCRMELSPAQHIAAVASGQVDAAYTYEPNGTIGHIQGLTDFLEVGVRSRYLLGNPSAPWYGGAAVITTDFIKSDPASTKKFVAGMKRGFDAVRKDINSARTAYTAYTPYDQKLVEAIPPISYTLYDEFKPADVQYFPRQLRLVFRKKYPDAQAERRGDALQGVTSSAERVADEPFITVRGLAKAFGGQVLYRDFDLDLPRGKFTTIFGPNGCGKSTLINMMSGLVPFDAGSVQIGGKDFRSARIGYVFQNYRDSLFPWMRALENIEYPLKVRGVAARAAARARRSVARGIRDQARSHAPHLRTLGGQQQLVAILRALVADPEVLFLDEPFSALDYEMTLYIRDKLQHVFMETGLTTVLVSHDLEEAVYLADRILLLGKRPTRIVELIPFDTERPRTIEIMGSPQFVETKQHALHLFREEMAR